VVEITTLIAETFDTLECHELGKVHWEWSSRFTSRMGDADLISKRMRFSRPLWSNASSAQRRETIVHEACHIATQELFDNAAWTRPHGREWLQVMEWAGYPNADACHLVSRHGAASVARASCNCRQHEVSLAAAKKHMSGRAVISCRYCRAKLMFVLEDL